MSSDVFVISTACDSDPSQAVRQALELGGVGASRIQDVIFGLDGIPVPDLEAVAREAGLECPAVGVSSSMRGLFFAAASILSDDAHLSLVVGLASESCAAILLASPESIGVLNLLPRLRLAGRVLQASSAVTGVERALSDNGLARADVQLTRTGEHGALLLHELLAQLEADSARWGLLAVGGSALLVERL
jgi:hypothetical protein